MRQPKVEFERGSDGKFYFHVLGSNGRISLPSEGYANMSNAVRGFQDAATNMHQAYVRWVKERDSYDRRKRDPKL